MFAAVIDTHAIIWFLSGDKRLSHNAVNFIRGVFDNGDRIGLSSISLVEMVYLVEKGKIPPQQFSEVVNLLESPKSLFIEVPVSVIIARAVSRVPADKIPDMPDRIIAATAVNRNVPLISRDGKIRVSGIETIW